MGNFRLTEGDLLRMGFYFSVMVVIISFLALLFWEPLAARWPTVFAP